MIVEVTNSLILLDGTKLNVGDIIRYDIAMHMGITRVILHDGKLCMESNFMYGNKTEIEHFIKHSNYNHITKLSLVDLYKLCKKNKWNTKEYMMKFGKINQKL